MPCLVVDCGGVLSSKDGQRFDGSEIYRQAVPGAYAFCQLFTKAYGHQQLQVLSRVNYPSEDHWVVRFCETMGLPHVSLVKEAVDDNSDCLYYISWYCWQSMEASSLHKPLVLFNKEGYRTGQRKPHDAWVRQRVVRTTSWEDVAQIFGCSTEPEKWDALSRLGPPFRPHSKTLVDRFWESATSSGGQALSSAATPSEVVAAAGARVAASATASSASRPCEAEVTVVAASATVTPKKEEEENKRAGAAEVDDNASSLPDWSPSPTPPKPASPHSGSYYSSSSSSESESGPAPPPAASAGVAKDEAAAAPAADTSPPALVLEVVTKTDAEAPLEQAARPRPEPAPKQRPRQELLQC